MNSIRHTDALPAVALALALPLTITCHAIDAAAPMGEARYHAKLFELIEVGEAKYDADFAKRFNSMLEPYAKEHRNFRARITSGAASDGITVQAESSSYFYFGLCQAHQCDATTMDVLFDPASKKMIAKVLDHCTAQWLGNPDANEQALLDTQHRIKFPATAQRCDAAK